MKATDKITVCIPVRIDSQERHDNLLTVVRHYARLPFSTILVSEADSIRHLPEKIDGATVLFTRDENPIFQRTHYINHMLSIVKTETAIIADCDVIVDLAQLETGISHVVKRGVTLSIPYDGRCKYVPPHISNLYRKLESLHVLKSLGDSMSLMNGYRSVGGIFVVNVKQYMAAGMENEHFTGWGPEDAERIHRLQILGKSTEQLPGVIYHLYHPRGDNSRFYDKRAALGGKEEYCRICSMERTELQQYISTWPWIRYR